MLKVVRTALKHAKQENLRSLSKKLKKNADQVAQLEAELHITKQLDLSELARKTAAAKLAKLKLLPSQSALKASLPSPTGAIDGWPEALLSQFPLLQAISPSSSVGEYHLQCASGGSGETRDPVRDRAIARLCSSATVSEQCTFYCGKISALVQKLQAPKSLLGSGADPKAPVEPENPEDDDDDDNDDDDDGLSGSDEMDPEDSGSIAGSATSVDGEKNAPHEEDGASDGSDSEDTSAEAEDGGNPKLPSLAGGYIGRSTRFGDRGSDSDWSDADEALENAASGSETGRDGSGQGTRKNRMGQRARKA
jgi:BUD22